MSFNTLKTEYYPKIKELGVLKLSDINVAIKNVKGYIIDSDWKAKLSLSVSYISENIFNRNFTVKLGIGDSVVKNITKELITKIGLNAFKVSNAGQVISDIRLYNKVLNETNYDETITPYGYGKWKVLVTGDYIYEKALCKYTMQASLNADRPNTRIYQHKVDVPDRVQTGTVVLDTIEQPLHVKFDDDPVRAFHVTPELNVSIKSYSGTDQTPLVMTYNLDRYGFDVTMKVGTEYIAGSITYAARGY